MNAATSTVFIVDDAQEVRTSLERVLSAAGYEVRAFDSAERFLDEHDHDAPGCLVLDLCMPGMSGLDAQRVLVDSKRARPIIFLTAQGNIEASVRAMKVGAVDFLTKPIEIQHLLGAVEQALRLDLAARAERAMRGTIEWCLESLTPRERQVMEHVIRGRLNKQIAADMRIGEKTVKVHRARVMSKMRVRSVAELVGLSTKAGILKESAFPIGVGKQS
jgi:FixJ family two-component response regulator